MEPKITLRLLTPLAALREAALDTLASAFGRLRTLRFSNHRHLTDAIAAVSYDGDDYETDAWYTVDVYETAGGGTRCLSPTLSVGRYALEFGVVRGTVVVANTNPHDSDYDSISVHLRTKDAASVNALIEMIEAKLPPVDVEGKITIHRGSKYGWNRIASGTGRSRDTVLLGAGGRRGLRRPRAVPRRQGAIRKVAPDLPPRLPAPGPARQRQDHARRGAGHRLRVRPGDD